MSLNWNFQRGGGGGSNQKALCWGSMDISWNNTLVIIAVQMEHGQ